MLALFIIEQKIAKKQSCYMEAPLRYIYFIVFSIYCYSGNKNTSFAEIFGS